MLKKGVIKRDARFCEDYDDDDISEWINDTNWAEKYVHIHIYASSTLTDMISLILIVKIYILPQYSHQYDINLFKQTIIFNYISEFLPVKNTL